IRDLESKSGGPRTCGPLSFGRMLAPMRSTAALLAVLLGCAGARAPPSASPNALKGFAIALPAVEDGRPSASAGCGQFAPDLPGRAENALYVALSEAGAQVERTGDLVLAVRLLYGGAAAEYSGSQRSPPGPDPATRDGFGPSLGAARGGVNA